MKTFEMTGFVSCKSTEREIKYKEDFVAWMKQWGWKHTKLTWQTDYLIYSREDTIKYKKAQMMNVPCITYKEALDMVEKREIYNLI